MEIVTGYVEHIVFRNEENGYTVFQLESDLDRYTDFHSFGMHSLQSDLPENET